MTDYLNPHRIYPDDISRRIDIAPGFDSVREKPTVKESLTTALDENGLVRCGCGCEPELRFDELGWYEVYCTGCDMHGGNSHIPDNVIEEWNTAMGWRADE